MDLENRIVALIDMDCFYCQVEEKLNPELKGKPIAVVQYNPWKGGGIIAVNYVARAMGVTRHMRGDEAKEKCPEIQLPSVPCQRGKADITKYRDAGKDVAKVLQKFTQLLERASIDEAYLDITASVQKRLRTLNINTVSKDMMPNTFALGYEDLDQFIADIHNCSSDSIDFDYEHAKQLLVSALIVSEIRAAVYDETGYRCSAGIGHNKILAKLVCGMNKPNKQTVLPKHSVNILYKTLSVKKVKHLGGKFGDQVCEVLRIKTMAELQTFSEKDLQTKFDEKNGTWLYNIARGIDLEPVQARFNPKSIGCCKQFRGKSALTDLESLKKWLKDLGDEIEDRLEKDALENNRTPKQMVCSFSLQMHDGRDSSSSRSYNFVPDDELCGELFTNKAFELLIDSAEGCKPKDCETNRKLKAPVKFLGISVGKFEDHSENKKTRKINDYFAAGTSKDAPKINENKQNKKEEDKYKNEGKDCILAKYFKSSNNEKSGTDETTVNSKINTESIQSPLDKQESFFAKYLNGSLNISETIRPNNEPSTSKEKLNPDACDDSNDTAYSGSTINEEINQSISLFEEDPVEIARVSNLRDMLKSNHKTDIDLEQSEAKIKIDINVPETNQEMIECNECRKMISLHLFDEHADYHLALKLRDEERQQIRKERDKIVKDKDRDKVKEQAKKKTQEIKIDAPSISNFFKKFDDTVETKTCTECSKKVPTANFAEHLDFHEAQKLSRELNNRTILTDCSSSTVKRKRKSASPVKKTKVPCKSIDLFFR